MKTDKDYYTPKETRELLGMTFSALQNQINIGNLHPITPPGKKQKVYPKKEVDELKAELEAWSVSRRLVKAPPTEFVKATTEDMSQGVALAHAVFGGVNTIPLETRLAWLGEHRVQCYSMKVDRKVVGYAFFLPLEPEKTENLLLYRRFVVDDENGEA